MSTRKVILVVLDSFGIGELPDAKDFDDVGANTLRSISRSDRFCVPNMESLGLFKIDGVQTEKSGFNNSFDDNTTIVELTERREFDVAYGRFLEKSMGKDTTIGHWEIAGVVSENPLPTFPEGFDEEFIAKLEKLFGRKVLCNKPYSGTEVIKDYGRESIEKGAVIVYTSADSVLQIAAHVDYVPLEELYKLCEIARKECTGKYGVGRVIARPFAGDWPYVRTKDRHDFSAEPPKETMLDKIAAAGKEVVGIGKIVDIFAGKGISRFTRTSGNPEGIERTIEEALGRYEGLLFVNLVDTDMLYGHRRDIDGYAQAISYFDFKLPFIVEAMADDDVLMITADHGCDPGFKGTDHTREYIPFLMVGKNLPRVGNFGTGESFTEISDMVLEILK